MEKPTFIAIAICICLVTILYITTTRKANAAQEMIKAYDENGNLVQITKEEWKTKVLPGILKSHWNDSNALYSDIVQSLHDGFIEEMLPASERLLEIDENKERSYTIRGIVLMRTNKLPESEQTLKQYLSDFGESGIILTNLAKVYSYQGDESKAEETLLKALKTDPNQDNGLAWWGSIHHEKEGVDGYIKAMKQIASFENAWLPQLWLAQKEIEAKNFDAAMAYYNDVMKVASDNPTAMMMISGDLGKNGYAEEVIKMFAHYYEPKKHDIPTGMNLLMAYKTTKDYQSGQKLLEKIKEVNRPDIKEHIAYFENEFNKLANS